MADVWPPAGDKCEANYAVVPFVAEFWSTLTAVAFVPAGLLMLLSSTYSDETLDLTAALVVINGLTSILAHGTLLRIFGQADQLSIFLIALLFLNGAFVAHSPSLYRQPWRCARAPSAAAAPRRTGRISPPAPSRRRCALNISLALALTTSIAWTPSNVAPSAAFDLAAAMGPATFGITLVMFCRLACGKATWHLGALKRIVLRGTAAAFVGTACWFIEQTGALPCPAPISLHPVWHLCAAFAMTHWGCFLKYHRGRFFGYRVAIRGYWWCPFATWAEPDASSPGRLSRRSAT